MEASYYSFVTSFICNSYSTIFDVVAFSLLSIIITKFLINHFALVYLILIDRTFSITCVQKLSWNLVSFQLWPYIIQFWESAGSTFVRNWKERILYLFLHYLHQPLHIQLRVHDLSLISPLSYVIILLTYIDTFDYIKASSPLCRPFDRFITVCLGRTIADMETEETPHEHMKKAQELKNMQSNS